MPYETGAGNRCGAGGGVLRLSGLLPPGGGFPGGRQASGPALRRDAVEVDWKAGDVVKLEFYTQPPGREAASRVLTDAKRLKRALSLLTRMTLHDNAPQDWGARNGTALILELTYRDGTVRTVAYFDGCLRIEGEAPPQGGRWLTVEGRPDLAARMQAL